MNRTAALLLALGIFLAHCLVIHQDANGMFAKPHEMAHVGYRFARNLVHHASPTWNPGEASAAGYPSLVWVGVCAVLERLYLGVTKLSQTFGIVFAMGTLMLVARFSRARMAGMVAPLLLAASGCMAAAATSGTELTLLALLLTASLLAYERRATKLLGPLLLLSCLTRVEGALFTLAILTFELWRRRRWGRETMGVKPVLRAFVLPAAGILIAAMLRWILSGHPLSAGARAYTDPRNWNPVLGWHYLRSFGLVHASALLAFLPLALLVVGRLRGVGSRSFLLALLLIGAVGLVGGDSQPFWLPLAPALPLLFLAVQESIIRILDTGRRGSVGLSAGLLAAGLVMSVFASRLPGNLGPISTFEWQHAWMQPSEALRAAYDQPLARLGLMQEIRDVDRLRSTGVFLRDHAPPGTTVLTPRPGAVGYISRVRVIDLLGRTEPTPGHRPNPWSGAPRVDLLAMFELAPDLILTSTNRNGSPSSIRRVISDWMERYDEHPISDERTEAIWHALRPYELIAVPVPARSDDIETISPFPVYLLRRRGLDMSPMLELHVDDDAFRVLVRHRGYHQVADLAVEVVDEQDQLWTMRPTGVFVPGRLAKARTEILLHGTGERRVELCAAPLPDGINAKSISALLYSPSPEDSPLSLASGRVTVEL